MKILIIHNKYGKHSGEESVLFLQIELLLEAGHEVITYFRSSEEIDNMFLGKFRAFFSSLFNLKSILDLRKVLKNKDLDIIHIHNLFPLISPSILPFIKMYKLPIVMTVHNYRLLCPNGLFFVKNKICEKCIGKGKELNAIINNCEKSYFKSIGYAIRNFLARILRLYSTNVDYFLCLTEFQRQKLIRNGFNSKKLFILNNVCDFEWNSSETQNKRSYVGYVGRISEEKGINTLIEAAKTMPKTNFRIAGSLAKHFEWITEKYSNIEITGFLNKEELVLFYRNAKFIVFPSICYETFGLTLIEAMSQKCAVIASDIAGISEIVENNKTGLLFKPGDAKDLKQKIELLLNSPQKAQEMGMQGYLKQQNKFRSKNHYDNLISIYKLAVL